MDDRTSRKVFCIEALLLFATCAALSGRADAQLFINEMFFNPGMSVTDDFDEYIEIRGTPGASLAGYYLIFVEGDDDAVGEGPAGLIDNVFDLNYNALNPELGQSLGSNGFLSMRQKGTHYQVGVHVNPNGNNLVNTGTGSGWGSGAGSSSLGATDEMDEGQLENSAFTAMIVRKDGNLVPAVGIDMDENNDGLDSSEVTLHWSNNWTIIDAVGLSASQEIEDSEFARLYAKVNYFADFAAAPLPPGWEPRIEPDADYEVLLYEFEYAGRWGNSTGQTQDDWHVSNITDNFGSGYVNNTFLLRQSGDPHPGTKPPTQAPAQPAIIESNQGAPYGTILTNTIGGPNYLKGDYNKDGQVDLADYVVWRNSIGQTGSEFVLGPPPMPLVPNHPPADGNHDFVVNDLDYAIWRAAFGKPGSGGVFGAGAGTGGSLQVPEPSSVVLAGLPLLAAAICCRRPRS